MKRVLTYLLMFAGPLITGHLPTSAQDRHIIELTDKRVTTFSLTAPQQYLSARALERRRRQSISIDSSDLPVCSTYIDSIRSIRNVTILNASKWLNQVAIRTGDAQALKRIRNFPFVKQVTTVANRPSRQFEDDDLLEETYTDAALNRSKTGGSSLNYGLNRAQIDIHSGAFLHDLGYRGEGMLIAMLDGGYQGYLTNPAFDSLRMNGRVLSTWDFVAGEVSVNEDNNHGSNCLSTMAANIPGKMIGTAPSASYLLFRTEDVDTEYPVEEHFWAVGAERADSAGADIINSSLGYTEFDNPTMDHRYADLNGNTTMVSRAADMAAGKGMIVCNSAGNSGASTWKYIGAPADGDSVLAIAAVNATGTVASFSSYGPSSDGQVKPDLASVGAGTFVALPNGSIVQGNGTSYASPNIAGLIACLWQAFPEFSNMEIIRALKESADRYLSPNDRTGYGIPDMKKAHQKLSDIRTYREQERILGKGRLKVYPVPFTDRINILCRAQRQGKIHVELIDAVGRKLAHRDINASQGMVISLDLTNLGGLPAGAYQLHYTEGFETETIRLLK
jgi:serine protease AprX